jgi:hypothetical protein
LKPEAQAKEKFIQPQTLELPSMSAPRLLITPLLLLAIGCGSSNPLTHPVQGRVQVSGGDAALLAGHSVEVALETDPTVRAYGEIREDGSFSLESLQAGEIQAGALEGTYLARIVLSDDDPERSRRVAATIDARALDFKTSGLSIQVPAAGTVALSIVRR